MKLSSPHHKYRIWLAIHYQRWKEENVPSIKSLVAIDGRQRHAIAEARKSSETDPTQFLLHVSIWIPFFLHNLDMDPWYCGMTIKISFIFISSILMFPFVFSCLLYSFGWSIMSCISFGLFYHVGISNFITNLSQNWRRHPYETKYLANHW